jgi:glucose-6-phosphate isomerase
MLLPNHLLTHFNPQTGEITGLKSRERLLESLRGYFLDKAAFEQSLQKGNPPVYSVASVEPADGDGQLHYGIGKLMPGKIGCEYFFTAGHFHAYRPAAEFYIGLSGEGLILLEDEFTGDTQVLPLRPNTAVYVPGYTAHRTVNFGSEPLTYLGVYSAQAGHDYGLLAKRNFNKVVLEIDGEPVTMDRQSAQEMLKHEW